MGSSVTGFSPGGSSCFSVLFGEGRKLCKEQELTTPSLTHSLSPVHELLLR